MMHVNLFSYYCLMEEREIIEGCIRNDQHCQRELFTLYAGKIKGILVRYIRNDARANKMLQEILVETYEHLRRGKWNWDVPFEEWAREMTIRKCMMRIRKEMTFLRFKPANARPQFSEAEADRIAPQMTHDVIMEVLYNMPSPHRILFNLYAVERWSVKRIAKELGLSERIADAGIKEARALLQRKIAERTERVYVSAL